jgi:hypothetical protein
VLTHDFDLSMSALRLTTVGDVIGQPLFGG